MNSFSPPRRQGKQTLPCPSLIVVRNRGASFAAVHGFLWEMRTTCCSSVISPPLVLQFLPLLEAIIVLLRLCFREYQAALKCLHYVHM
jgi:hypothetical protein